MSEVLKAAGYNVTSSDLIDRGYGAVKSIFDYEHFNGDIITNPPYKLALDCVKKSLDIVDNGRKVAMFLKIQFLESKARREFFEQCPPKVLYVASRRLMCAKNGDFEQYKGAAMSFCWFIWEKAIKAIQSLNGLTNKIPTSIEVGILFYSDYSLMSCSFT